MSGKMLVIALVVAAVVAPAAQARVPKPRCLTTGRTVQANGVARLFYVGDKIEHELYLCWRRTRVVHRIGTLELEPYGPELPVLSGRWAAYDDVVCDHYEGTCNGRIVVRDAQTGKRVRVSPTQDGVADQLVLTTGGLAAWTRKGAVYALGRSGTTQLDAGPGSGSLALAGARVYWLRAGNPMSALVV